MSSQAATARRHWQDVVLLLVARDFRGRYKHTKVGIVWSFMTPLLFLLIFYFLFTQVIDLQIPRYATFVFIGIIVWGWTQTALLQAVTSISGNPGLVNQPSFPLPALPVIAVTSALLNLLIALPLMLTLAWVEGARPSLALASLPLVIGVQFLLILGVAYLVAAVNVAFRDIEQVLPILLQLGYYITPVFFSLARVPPQFVPLFRANPMASLMTNYRRVVMDGSWPIWSELGLVLALALILLVVGIHYFQRARFRFLEEL